MTAGEGLDVEPVTVCRSGGAVASKPESLSTRYFL